MHVVGKAEQEKKMRKAGIYQGCQRDILVTVRCCFRLVAAKKVPPANPKVGGRLVWRSNPSPV